MGCVVVETEVLAPVERVFDPLGRLADSPFLVAHMRNFLVRRNASLKAAAEAHGNVVASPIVAAETQGAARR